MMFIKIKISIEIVLSSFYYVFMILNSLTLTVFLLLRIPFAVSGDGCCDCWSAGALASKSAPTRSQPRRLAASPQLNSTLSYSAAKIQNSKQFLKVWNFDLKTEIFNCICEFGLFTQCRVESNIYFADGGAALLKPAAKQKKVDNCSILFDSAGIFWHFGLLLTAKGQFNLNFVWVVRKRKKWRNFTPFC